MIQAQSADDASLVCSVYADNARTPQHEVCRFEAQTAQYDGRPCVFFLPPQATYTCTTRGEFYWMGTHASTLARDVVAPVVQWAAGTAPCRPKGAGRRQSDSAAGDGGNCTWSAPAGHDSWVVLGLGAPSFDDTAFHCTIGNTTVCAYRSVSQPRNNRGVGVSHWVRLV